MMKAKYIYIKQYETKGDQKRRQRMKKKQEKKIRKIK